MKKNIYRFVLPALFAACIAANTAAQGQFKIYRVQAEPSVVGSNLQIDIYIQRFAGTAFSLASSNFALQLNSTGLDIANAQMVTTRSGPWDSQTDRDGYNLMNVATGPSHISLNVNCKSFFKSQNPGPGQPVSGTRTQVGRVLVPITDPTQTVNLSWMLTPMAVMNWSGQDVKDQGIFELVTNNIPLCTTPATPTLTFTPQNVYCQGTPVTLTSSFSGINQWYLNGQPINGQTGSTFAVTQSGSYTAMAVVGVCSSAVSQAASFTFVPTKAPVITYANRQFVSNITTGLQWFFQGQPIANATGATLTPERAGKYKVVHTNACGTFTSNELEWLLGSGEGDPNPPVGGGPGSGNNNAVPTAASATVFPNPYVGTTMLSYALPQDQEVTILINNSAGVQVGTPFKQTLKRGRYNYSFSARDLGLPAGTYFIKVNSQDINTTFKVTELQ